MDTNDGSGSAETSGTGTFFSDYSTTYNRECAQCFWCFKLRTLPATGSIEMINFY